MPHVDLPTGIRIRYDERGDSAARPLVLAHGFGVSLEMWMPQMHALSQDYRLITWDARGHGGSSAPEEIESYSMPALAADLRGLLDAIDAVDGAVIGGMSFGGQIALQYAVDHLEDVHALILSDSTTRGADAAGPARRGSAYEGDPGLTGAMHAMRTRPDLTPELPGLDLPALVICGTHDDLLGGSIQRVIDGLPRRRVVWFDGCGHGTSGQRPGAWNDAVLEFLRDVETGAPLGEDTTR
jgi:pimeloyl-ACP methyl ester carboxylesterase